MWYKIKVQYGGGHQAKGLTFRHRESSIPESDMQRFFDEVCDEQRWRNASGKITKVRYPSKKWLDKEIKRFEYNITALREEVELYKRLRARYNDGQRRLSNAEL